MTNNKQILTDNGQKNKTKQKTQKKRKTKQKNQKNTETKFRSQVHGMHLA